MEGRCRGLASTCRCKSIREERRRRCGAGERVIAVVFLPMRTSEPKTAGALQSKPIQEP